MMSEPDYPPSLAPLFARLSAKDPAAVNDILAHCQERLKALTRRMLHRAGRLRDTFDTSEVYGRATIRFMKALRRLPMAAPEDFLRLAARQIRWTLIDLLRGKRVVGMTGGPGLHRVEDPRAADPVSLAMWGEFHEAVADLPDDDRRLFDLLFYQELGLTDAGYLLGVPYSTLRLRWQQARARLAARFRYLSPV